MNEITATVPDETSEIIFNADKDNWVMKITRTPQGPIIQFNTKRYPNCLPDDFAQAIGDILQRSGYLDIFLDQRIDDKKND